MIARFSYASDPQRDEDLQNSHSLFVAHDGPSPRGLPTALTSEQLGSPSEKYSKHVLRACNDGR